MDWFPAAGVATAWRIASFLMLGWLAFFFGRTLVSGRMPLIERIARVSDPELCAPLARYTRSLTAAWSAYFVLAALLGLSGWFGPAFGAWVGLGSALFFVGEHGLRRLVFPGQPFPGIAQQVRDTWSVWHPRKRIAD